MTSSNPPAPDRLRILIAESENFSPRALSVLESLGDVTLGDVGQAGLADAVAHTDVVFVRLRNRVDGSVLNANRELLAVVSPTTGLDHIALDVASAQDTAVLSLRAETDFLETVTATAEHTWALLLALVRRLPEAVASTRRGGWDRDAYRGRELAGKTLALVGVGRLGIMVARYARAFGMHVTAYDPDRDPWPDGVTRAPSLEVLAERADVLSIHAPLNESTRGLVGRAALSRLPQGALVVNTARGGLLDEDALLDGLRSGRLGGAALDVLASETDAGGVASSPVLRYAADHEHLLVTPHIGGATLESMENTEIFMAEKLARWLAGTPVRVDAGPKRYVRPVPPFTP